MSMAKNQAQFGRKLVQKHENIGIEIQDKKSIMSQSAYHDAPKGQS